MELGTEEMYQFILVNSSDENGIINVTDTDCMTSFEVTLTYNVSYYMAVFVKNEDQESIFIPTKQIYVSPNNTTNNSIRSKLTP